CAIGHTSGLLF
nr:immunoglobulin light chain junction region [Macaca mulatta]